MNAWLRLNLKFNLSSIDSNAEIKYRNLALENRDNIMKIRVLNILLGIAFISFLGSKKFLA